MVGAGPGGATCARELAAAGLRTVLVDRQAPPRYKTCGGGLIWRARRALELDLGAAVESEARAAELHLLDAGLCFRVERREPLITMTLRATLDARLVEAARDAGARLAAPAELKAIDPCLTGLRVLTTGGAIECRFLVGADGAAGTTARAGGWSEERRLVPALESEIEVPRELFDRFDGRARFDFGLTPHGYAWVFPKRRQLSVGCLTLRPGGRALGRDLERYLARLGLDRPLSREDHGYVIPVRPRRRLARGRVLLVGDAAGLADPVTCEGISWAIDSGRRAARAIAAHRDDPEEAARAYRRSVARELLPELARARWLARLLYGAPRLRSRVFRRLGQPLCERIADVMTGRVTYRGLLRPGDLPRLAARLLRAPL